METALAVADGIKHKLQDDDLGMLQRRLNEIVRRIEEGTISHWEVKEGLQAIIEGKRSQIGKPCTHPHRGKKIDFVRPSIRERKKSLAHIRMRSQFRQERLYFKCRLALKGNRFPKASERLLAEDIIVQMWEAENIPSRSLNYGAVPLHTILEREGDLPEHDVKIVNQTIQWLGTNVGKDFLRRFVLTADLHMA